jgi:hypothetical protein
MPVPPPVDSTQRYPVAIRDFCTYADQPQDGTKWIQAGVNPDGTPNMIDLTIDAATITNDLHTEIRSIETTLGINPWVLIPLTGKLPVTGTTVAKATLGATIQYLYLYKAWIGHNHVHHFLTDLSADSHPVYVPRNASRGFTRPVQGFYPDPRTGSGYPNIHVNQLIRLMDVPQGLTIGQIEAMINAELVNEARGGPLVLMGGVAQGYTDGYGNLYVPFGAGFHQLYSFVYMKMPFPGLSMLGWYAYQYMEDQLTLVGLNNQGAWIQFIEDIQVDRRALVCMVWLAIGR